MNVPLVFRWSTDEQKNDQVRKEAGLLMERCQKEEVSWGSDKDWSRSRTKASLWGLLNQRSGGIGWRCIHHCLFFDLSCANATNKLIPTLPLLIRCVGIGIGFLLPNSRYHLDTELFGLGYWTASLSRSRSRHYSILKHWRIIAFGHFGWALSLGWLAHLLWP